MEQYEKKGYLNSEFRLFHLTDQETKEVDYHYHDFDKITIFIRGKVNYMIEGRSYDLKPYDIVLVKQGDIHRLTVDNSCPYERIIVYISPNFMNAYQTDNYDYESDCGTYICTYNCLKASFVSQLVDFLCKLNSFI